MGVGGEVEDDLGFEVLHGAIKRGGIADVTAEVFDCVGDVGDGEEVGG